MRVKLFLILNITILFLHLQIHAHGTRGGGNFTAAEFVALAREIKLQLTITHAWSNIGVSAAEFEKAISSTKVVCATSQSLKNLVSKYNDAFYESKNQTIYLNCSRWQKRLTKGIPTGMKVTLFHEYMRALGKEDSDYRISSNIHFYLPTGSSWSATEDLERAIFDGDIRGIYQAVKNGAVLNSPTYPFICLIAGINGGRWTESTIDGQKIRIDSESGPILSVDEKVSLIYYLTSLGADPNFPCNENDKKSALHEAGDPIIIEALIKVGANPTQKTISGVEPLLGFLFNYPHYENKAYFRVVVKYLLDMGADPYNCFSDQSACVTSFSKGNDELAQLIKAYMK